MTPHDRAIEAGARALCLATFGDKTVHGDARCCQAGGTDGCCIQEVKPLAKACIDAALAAEGLVVVPKDATDQMAVAGGIDCEGIIFGGAGNYPTIFDAMKKIYGTMIANRPLAAAQNGGE